MAFANFSLTDAYNTILDKLNTQLTAIGKLFRDQATGDFTNQVRYSSTNKRLEYWTGSAWAALDMSATNAGSILGKTPSDFATAAQGALANGALPASSYTAVDVLAKLLTVDGAGSGLDADTVDGIQGSALITTSNIASQSVASATAANNGCKAWVTFDGTQSGTITPLAGSNVANITKNGTGDYTINFSVVMPANFAWCYGLKRNASIMALGEMSRNTASLRVICSNMTSGSANAPATDVDHVCITFFG